MSDNRVLTIVSGVSAFNGKPYCQVTWGQQSGQLTPDEVREMASHWFDAAAAAEHDALLMAELTKGVGLDLQTAGGLLLNLRKRREATGK